MLILKIAILAHLGGQAPLAAEMAAVVKRTNPLAYYCAVDRYELPLLEEA